MKNNKIHYDLWLMDIMRRDNINLDNVNFDTIKNDNGKITYKTKTCYIINWQCTFFCFIACALIISFLSMFFMADLGIGMFTFILLSVAFGTYWATWSIYESEPASWLFSILSTIIIMLIYLNVLANTLPTDDYWYTDREFIHWLYRAIPEWVYKFKF